MILVLINMLQLASKTGAALSGRFPVSQQFIIYLTNTCAPINRSPFYGHIFFYVRTECRLWKG